MTDILFDGTSAPHSMNDILCGAAEHVQIGWHTRVLSPSSTTYFLNLGIVDILGWIIHFAVESGDTCIYSKTFSSIPGLYTLDVRSIYHPLGLDIQPFLSWEEEGVGGWGKIIPSWAPVCYGTLKILFLLVLMSFREPFIHNIECFSFSMCKDCHAQH